MFLFSSALRNERPLTLCSAQRARWLPSWFLPFALMASQVWPLELQPLTCAPECYIVSLTSSDAFASSRLCRSQQPSCFSLQLQIHGILLSALALLSPSSEPRKIPRSSRHPSPAHQLAHSPFSIRLFALFSLVAVAHFAAQFSTHCPTSPSLSAVDGVLASRKSVTGWISVGEYDVPGPDGDDVLTMRYLRADHSLLGGLWVGRSRTELAHRTGSRGPVTEKEVVRNAESIFSTFLLQEIVRLVVRPPELPSKKPEQGLVMSAHDSSALPARVLS